MLPLPSSVDKSICHSVPLFLHLKEGAIAVTITLCWPVVLPRPTPYCVSPTLFSGLPTLPLLTADIPGPGAPGKHSVVCSRLSGSLEPQMWAEWAAARRAQAGGWGDCAPPTPHSSTGHPVGVAVGGTHRWEEGASPLLTVLPQLLVPLEQNQVLPAAHKALSSPHPLSPSLTLLQPHGPPCYSSNTPGTSYPRAFACAALSVPRPLVH